MLSVMAASDEATVVASEKSDTNKPEAITNGHSATTTDLEEKLTLNSIDDDSHKLLHNEESEEDILNKIETEATDVVDDHLDLDSHAEDSILNDSLNEDEEHQQANEDEANKNEEQQQINENEEFKSLYEDDIENKMEVDEMDIIDEPVVLTHSEVDIKEEDITMDDINTTTEDVNTKMEGVNTTMEDVNTATEDVNTTMEDVNTTKEDVNTEIENVNTTMEDVNATMEDVNASSIEEPKEVPKKPLILTVPLPIKEEPDPEEPSEKPIQSEKVQIKQEVISDAPSNKAIFKVPDEIPIEKSMDDETELLDISMIRETDEDDACAIADAIAMEDNKDTPRSDEDQSEKAETSDGDGATHDDETSTNGFVVLEEDSRMDGDEENAGNTEPSKENSDESNEAKEEEVNKENDPVVAENNSELNKTDAIIQDKEGDNISENELVIDEAKNADDKRKSKRALPTDELDDLNTKKKPKLVDEAIQEKPNEPEPQNGEVSQEPTPPATEEPLKLQTLTSFADFMQCRKITKKLTRSDLEEICIQKICEVLVLKSAEGELYQTIKKQEQNLTILRKDVHQLTKQYKDLDIVHKKLLAELKSQKETGEQKPMVPLKITRSVGLQVRLSPGNEPNQTRRRQPTTTIQPKTILSPLGRQIQPKVGIQQPAAVRQVLGSPQKPITKINQTSNAPMLSQALQKQKPKVVAKRATPSPLKKPAEAAKKPAAPGVIDLTDEDDKKSANNVKFRTIAAPNNRVVVNNTKAAANKSPANQNKSGNKLPAALPQGLRLTPASVISSTATSSPQMLYVVPTITSNAGGQQKVAFVNFQPTNSVLPGTINGAVINKPGQSLTIKNIATTSTVSSSSRPKHPAPLPTTLRVNADANLKLTLPKPMLTIKKLDNGIILQWKMPYNLDLYETIASYQLYAYQETTALPSTDMWRKVGDVKALALPMACTLTQFADKNKYYFAVRAVDVFQRIGAFSEPEEISL